MDRHDEAASGVEYRERNVKMVREKHPFHLLDEANPRKKFENTSATPTKGICAP